MSASLTLGDYTVFLRRSLGRGTFGNVLKATHRDGRDVAAKLIDSLTIKKHPTTTDKELMAVYQIPKNHDNIIKIYNIRKEYLEDEDGHNLWIMMECCQHGNLSSYLSNHPLKFDDIEFKVDLMCQFSSGLEYLHDLKIIHRDIKPGNILVGQSPTDLDQVIIKIADFGLCKYLDPFDSGSTMSSNVGTANFKAPEFWNRASDDKVQYKKSVDIFAAGLTLLSMIQPMGQNGILTPRIEGGHIAGELSNPIGLSMYNRKMNNQRQLTLVIEIGGNPLKANMIRRIIRQATVYEPSERISASQMHSELNSLASGRTVSLAALPEPMDVSEPFVEVNGEMEIPDNMAGRDAGRGMPNEETFQPAANPKPFKPSVPGKEIMEISSKVAPSAMTQVAILFLDVEMNQIRMFQAQHRENVQMVNYGILDTWVRNNPGQSARKMLHGLLSQASKRGIISPDAYSCLLDEN